MNFWKICVFSVLPATVLFGFVEGVSWVYWVYLEKQAFNAISANREGKANENEIINFLKQSDAVLGYRLRQNIPGWTNSKGFAQVQEIVEGRVPGSLRIAAVGESTTQGLPHRSYPFFLSQILSEVSYEYQGVPEVLNAGVSGWVSDQWAIYSERELNRYEPDVVIFYAGWNDFQSYDPFQGVPRVSYFQASSGTAPVWATYLKSVTLGSAIFHKIYPKKPESRYPVMVDWKVMKDAKIQTSLTLETKAELEKSGYVSILIDATNFLSNSHNSYRVKFYGKGTNSAILRINGYTDKTWPLYTECSISFSENWKQVDCPFKKPADSHGVQISIFPRYDEHLNFSVKKFELSLTKADESREIVAMSQASINGKVGKSIYHFMFENMTRSINAFRRSNKNVTVVVSSLVPRWPMDTEAQFKDPSGHVWWMKSNRVGRQDAAMLVKNLNKELKQFAINNGLIFVNMEEVFNSLDRQRLMIDFCHMTADGYKIMASIFYKELHRRNIVRGMEMTEYDHLLQEYTLNDSGDFSAHM